MAISTIYDVKVRYMLQDKATRSLDNIDKGASRASRSFGLLNRAFAVAAGAFGISKVVSATVGFNVQLEKTQAQIRSLLQLNLGGSFADNNKRSITLLKQFRQDAKETPGTFQDMADFSGRIAGNITRAGGSMEDLRQITKGGVIAANLMGEEAGLAARDIQQALAGTLTNRDRFAKSLIEPFLKAQGVSKDFLATWNKMVKSSPGEAVKLLGKVFNQKAIKDAARAFQTSFAGASSTLKSNLQEFGGVIGEELFAALTVQIVRINRFFTTNQARIRTFAKQVGAKLLQAFKLARDTFAFLFRHRKLLMTLATAFIAFKGAKTLAQPFLLLSQVSGQAASGLGRFVGKMPIVLGLLGGLAVAISRIVDQDQEAKLKAKGDTSQLRAQLKRLQPGRERDKAARSLFQSSGKKVLSSQEISQAIAVQLSRVEFAGQRIIKNGKINQGALQRGFGVDALDLAREKDRFSFTPQNVKDMRAAQGRLQFAIREHGTAINTADRNLKANTKIRIETAKAAKLPGGATDRDQRQVPEVSVGKMVFNVESNDPDRFAIALESIFQDLLANGGQAATTQFEGGGR